MDDLATLCGRPRTVTGAGRRWQLWPLRLCDLGDLQSWLYDQVPDPMRAIQSACDGLGRGARSFTLRQAMARRRQSRPTFGNPTAEQLCGSIRGQSEILWLSIRRGRPRFRRSSARRLYEAIGCETAREWTRWAIDGRGNPTPPGVLGLENHADRDDEESDRFDWWKTFYLLSQLPNWSQAGAGRGWTPQQIAELTIPQLCVIGNERPPGDGERASDHDAIRVIKQAQNRYAREVAEWDRTSPAERLT